MSGLQLIDAVKSGDLAAIEQSLQSGSDVNQQDENGWTPLNWAAGRRDLAAVRLLLDKGADVFKVGRDQRTPYMIALAAGHADVVRVLREAEDKTDPSRSSRRERKYCKAYHLSELREYSGWSESRINWKEKKSDKRISEDFSGDDIVFIHQDFTVTQSMWHDENVIFNQVSADWKSFCQDRLGFKVPDDLDLIVESTAN